MSDALYTLASWFSPSFPVGAFSYSHGLEWAVRSGGVADARALEHWIADCLEHGAGRSDAILLAAAYREPANDEIAEFAAALQPSKERRLESLAQGAAFAKTAAEAWGAGDDAPLAYPIAVGRAALARELPLADTVEMYLHAFAANLVSAGIRLVPLGQTEGQSVQAALMPVVKSVTAEALASDWRDAGTACIMADIASMRHEQLQPRIFRS